VVLRDYDGDGRDSDGKRIGDKPRATLSSRRTRSRACASPRSARSFSASTAARLEQRLAASRHPRPASGRDRREWATRRRRPTRLVDNEHTLLAEADLVFIDPVGTGHSRMVEGEKVAEFHEYQRDLDAGRRVYPPLPRPLRPLGQPRNT
jgi:hypothetical protein